MKFIHEKNKIYVKDENDKIIVLATFPFVSENVINVDHTFVDPSMRGRGIASLLMEEVYKHAKEHNYTVVNTCPYAVNWFKKHTDKQDVLNKDIKMDEACKIL